MNTNFLSVAATVRRSSFERLRTNALAAIAGLAVLLVAAPAAGQIPDARAIARDVRNAVQSFGDLHLQERRGPEQTEKITKSFKVGKAGTLDLSNLSGNITVTGGAGEEISLEAVKRVRAKTPEEAKKQLGAIQINITERAGRVDVRTEHTAREIRGGVDYTATVPGGASVFVKTMSGGVKITNVRGELRAETVSGDVTIAGAGALVRAKVFSGNVAVSDISGDGEVSFGSLSGNVTARNVKAKSVDASTTSGNVTLIDVTCDRASGRTMSGDVEYTGPLAKAGRYEFRSHSGNVRVTPTSTTGFEVEANTFSGTFRSDFPVTLRSVGPAAPAHPAPPAPPAPPSPPGRTTRDRPARPDIRMGGGPPTRSVQGTYGDGSAVLSLTSFSGDITIVKK